jgi:ribonuclease E
MIHAEAAPEGEDEAPMPADVEPRRDRDGGRNRNRFRNRNRTRDHRGPRDENAAPSAQGGQPETAPQEGEAPAQGGDENANPNDNRNDFHRDQDGQRRRRRGRRGGRRRGNERDGNWERRPRSEDGNRPSFENAPQAAPSIPTSIHDLDTTPRAPSEERSAPSASGSSNEIVNPPSDRPKGGWWRRLTGQEG